MRIEGDGEGMARRGCRSRERARRDDAAARGPERQLHGPCCRGGIHVALKYIRSRRLFAWKVALQQLADDTRLSVSVCHFPPGTSKWNKVEHRLFSFISSNWRGEPLRDYETIVNLIARTTTAAGLKVTCRLDRRKYATGRRISNEAMTRVRLVPAPFHGEWNYTIHPATKRKL